MNHVALENSPTMNHLQLSSLNLFSSQTTDRAPEQRSTETTLACLINSESSRFLPVSGTNVFVRWEASGYRAALLSLIEFEKTFGVLVDYVYLGREFDQHYFATIRRAPCRRYTQRPRIWCPIYAYLSKTYGRF